MRKNGLKINVKSISAIVILASTAIIVTPVCGFLFHCGCNWPWLGLDDKCNFFQPGATDQCPWCASLTSGLSSIASAIIGSVMASFVLPLPMIEINKVNEAVLRISFGLAVFLCVSALTAGIAAFVQNYSLGIGNFFRLLLDQQ